MRLERQAPFPASPPPRVTRADAYAVGEHETHDQEPTEERKEAEEERASHRGRRVHAESVAGGEPMK
jgi:hypothetical protein